MRSYPYLVGAGLGALAVYLLLVPSMVAKAKKTAVASGMKTALGLDGW